MEEPNTQQCELIETQNDAILKLRNRYLRTVTGDIVQDVNSILKNADIQLMQTDYLSNRLASESRLCISKFRKLKGGRPKSEFDNEIKHVSISKEIICKTNTSLITPNKGLRVDNASASHKKRVLKTFRENAKSVLEFSESFGVIPKNLQCESLSGETLSIPLNRADSCNVSYENMSSAKQQEVKKVLSVCDTAMVSDETYHEFAMLTTDLPRKHHLIACRNEMNETQKVTRAPGMVDGSYLSIFEDLQREIRYRTDNGKSINQPLKLKVSGDGAKVSNVSNFVVMSYSVVEEHASQTHTNQKTLGIVNCNENYENLTATLGPLLQEIDCLNTESKISVDDVTYQVEMFVGGDMKFIQLLLGLNSSIATYACPWCKVSKDNRGDISYPENFYNSPEMMRTVAELKHLCTAGKDPKYGVKHPPLLHIEPHHYIPDELHMLMRITDVLLRNLFIDAESKDDFAKLSKDPTQSTDNVEQLVNDIRYCGINTFKSWVSRATGERDWSSLSGNNKKKLLEHLPDRLVFCLHKDTETQVIGLWREFGALYSDICSGRNADTLFESAKLFIQHFIELGRKREGYHPKNVTPYMHALLYHIPYFVKRYGGLNRFSGQGVEKTNDVVKQLHQMKSNKLDATRDALLVRKRLENHAQHSSRTKRSYRKLKCSYWHSGIRMLRQSKKKTILNERRMEHDKHHSSHTEQSIDELTTKEIRARLKVLGQKVGARTKRETLIKQLKYHMSEVGDVL